MNQTKHAIYDIHNARKYNKASVATINKTSKIMKTIVLSKTSSRC